MAIADEKITEQKDILSKDDKKKLENILDKLDY